MHYRRLGEQRGHEVPAACTDQGLFDLRPIARPGKVVCVGLNYRDHAQETGAQLTSEPVVFMKDPATDEVEDVQRLEIGLAVNGVPRQGSSTAEMLFGDVVELWISGLGTARRQFEAAP